MNTTFNDEQTTLSNALDQVILQHGRLRVATAVLRHLLRHRAQPRVMPIPLGDHLRRDIGLPPHPPDP